MKSQWLTILMLLSAWTFAQEKPVEVNPDWLDTRFVKSSFDYELIPFDSEKRLFVSETVYTELDFERKYVWGKGKTSSAGSKLAGLAAYGLVRGLLFVVDKGLEEALEPKEKAHVIPEEAEENPRGKGIRR